MNPSLFNFNIDKWVSDVRVQDAPLSIQGFLINARCWCYKGSGRWKDGMINPKINPKVNPPLKEILDYLTKTSPPLLVVDGDDLVAPDIVTQIKEKGRRVAAGKKGGNPAIVCAPRNPNYVSQFLNRWKEAFRERGVGEYSFVDGRDAKATKGLLAIPGETQDTLIALAKRAWKHNGFWSRQASTLVGFYSKFNEIRDELNGGAGRGSDFSGWGKKEEG